MSQNFKKTRGSKPQVASDPKAKRAVKSPESNSDAPEGKPVSVWPVFDSIAHCSGVTGIPKDRLQDWKKAGAPGFRGSRVYFGELLPWMTAKIFAPVEAAETGEWLPPVLEWSDAEAKQRYLTRAGVLIETEKAMAIYRDGIMPIRQFLLGMPSILGHRCNPTDPEHARKAIEAHVRQGMRMIADAESRKITE